MSQCVFCDEFEDGSDRVIWEDDEWVVLPGKGAFVPGYCLLLSVACVKSFSYLPSAQLRRADGVVERVRQVIADHYGRPVVVAEHGVDASCPYLGSACCTDHNHLHFFPLPKGVNPEEVEKMYVEMGGAARSHESLAELTGHAGAYLLLSPTPGRYLIWQWDERFGKQYARRVVAGLGGESRWDWRRHPFPENMQETVDVLRHLPRPW